MTIQSLGNPLIRMTISITNSCLCCDKDDQIQQVTVTVPTEKKEEDSDSKKLCRHCQIV